MVASCLGKNSYAGEGLSSYHRKLLPRAALEKVLSLRANSFELLASGQDAWRIGMAFANYDRAGVGAAVNADTVYVALLFSTDLGLPPPKPEGPATTATPFDSPAAASAAPQPPAPDPLRLRGTTGGR